MIAWGYYLTYKGYSKPTVLRIYPDAPRQMVRDYAKDAMICNGNTSKVVKVRVEGLPQCGCGIVDDIGVACKRHGSKKGTRSHEKARRP
jgi:hypothetical protein